MIFNQTRKMTLAVLAAMSFAGAGVRREVGLPIDGTAARTMAVGGERRAAVGNMPSPPDGADLICVEYPFYEVGGNHFVSPFDPTSISSSAIFRAMSSSQIDSYDYLAIGFDIPGDVFDSSYPAAFVSDQSVLQYMPVMFQWTPTSLQNDTFAIVLDAAQVRSLRARGTLGDELAKLLPTFDVNSFMAATGGYGSELLSVFAGGMPAVLCGFDYADDVPPTITQRKAIGLPLGGTLSSGTVGSYVAVSDNVAVASVSYAIDGTAMGRTGWTWAASTVGSHTLRVTASDTAGNTATKTFPITVSDTKAPVIRMRDGGDGSLLVGLSRTIGLAEEDFLALFEATDDDPAFVPALAIEGDFIPSRVGNYDIKVVCSDASGNKGSFTCHVTVDADLPPVFVLSDGLVGATADSPLSGAQIRSIVVNAVYAGREVSDVLVDDGEYRANATRPGSYPVPYSVRVLGPDGSLSTEEGSLTVRVDDPAGDPDGEGETGWERFLGFWERLGNWFKGVFTKFEWDCFITDEEWEARFPGK